MALVDAMKMKVLIVCEHFAPETGAQALQATKVADALHDAGCDVRVLCGVQRVSPDEHHYPVEHVVPRARPVPHGVVARVRRRVRHEFDSIDSDGDWVLAMATKVADIARTFDPDVVMTQSTPFRAHLVGLHLPERLRARWVAYFSDLWPLALTPHPYRTRLSSMLKPVQMRALVDVLSTARGVLYSNDVSVRRLASAWPRRTLPPCRVVTHIGTPLPRNTADSLDPGLAARYGTRFVHIGKITRERVVSQLIDAIAEMSHEIGPMGRCTGFTFVGDVDASFRRLCGGLERSGVIDFVGEVDPAEAQAIGRAARALLVIEAPMNESPFLASKFADYAMMRKPILAISPAGPIRDYLTVHGGGVAADHDVASIAGAISVLLKDDGFALGSETLAAQFDASRVARQYVDAFRALV